MIAERIRTVRFVRLWCSLYDGPLAVSVIAVAGAAAGDGIPREQGHQSSTAQQVCVCVCVCVCVYEDARDRDGNDVLVTRMSVEAATAWLLEHSEDPGTALLCAVCFGEVQC